MPHLFPRSLVLLPLCLLLWLAAGVGAQTPSGWADGEHLGKGLTYAKENRVPLVILNIRKGQKDKEARVAEAWRDDRRFAGMAKVLVWKEKAPNEFKEIERQVTLGKTQWPRLFVLDPEGRVVAFASYDHAGRFETIMSSATAVLDWQSKVEKRLAAADAAAKAGRFKEAMTTLDAVVKEDEQASAAVRAVRGGKWDDTDRLKLEEVSMGGIFFPSIKLDRLMKYEQMAQERVAAAQGKRDAGELQEALQMLQPMLLADTELGGDDTARDLADGVRQLMRDEQARLAAERAAQRDDENGAEAGDAEQDDGGEE